MSDYFFLSRRQFLRSSATATALGIPVIRAVAQANAPVTLVIHADKPGPALPSNYIGLSYEIEQLKDPTFFSPENRGLIEQFQALSRNGVLRLGGNTSDVGWWKPTAESKQPPMNIRNTGTGEPNSSLIYAITPESITNLRAFLDATGWTCLFGINLGTNTPDRAADQAAFVAKTLGRKLEYFQIGNEPDLFRTHLRDPKTWNANTYFDEWSAMAHAIAARVPDAKFGLPDTAGNPEWYAAVVDRLLAMPAGTAPRIAALTHHYYFGGPPANPRVNIERLLQSDPKVLKLASDISSAASRLSGGIHAPVPFRMSEGNTCYRGGKPGVSDVFAASLWAADYALLLASLGYSGINLHGGSAKQVANSLGGHLPGEDLLTNPNEPHPKPFYTPIADFNGKYEAEPVNFGLRFAGHFAGGTMLPVTFSPGGVNATAYAAKLPSGQTIVAIINKDADKPLHIDLPGYSVGRTLTGQSLTSHTVEDREAAGNREASTVPPATAMLFYRSRA